MGLSTFNVTVGIIINSAEGLEKVSAIMGIPQSQRYDSSRAFDKEVCYIKENSWIYRVQYGEQTDIENCVRCFLELVPDFSSKLAKIHEIGECVLRISIVSLYAQLGISLSSNMLKLLNNLNIPFEITVFSFGNCIDEADENSIT